MRLYNYPAAIQHSYGQLPIYWWFTIYIHLPIKNVDLQLAMFNFTRRSNLSNHHKAESILFAQTPPAISFGGLGGIEYAHRHTSMGFFLLRVRAEAYRKRRRSPVAWGELRARWKAMVWRQKVASSYGCSSPKTPQNISTHITQYVIHIYNIISYYIHIMNSSWVLSHAQWSPIKWLVISHLTVDHPTWLVRDHYPAMMVTFCRVVKLMLFTPSRANVGIIEFMRPSRIVTKPSFSLVPWYGMIWFGHPAPKSQGETSLKSLRCNLDDSYINLMPAGVNANCLWSLTIFWPRFIGISTWLRGLALFPGTQNTIEHVDLNEPDHFCRK